MARGARWSGDEYQKYVESNCGQAPDKKVKKISKKATSLKAFVILVKASGLPEPTLEFKFHDTRRWRVDCCFVADKLAVEIEGGVWTQGRHTRGSGFVKDMEKYNALAKYGYHLMRFTPDQVESGYALAEIIVWFNMNKGENNGVPQNSKPI